MLAFERKLGVAQMRESGEIIEQRDARFRRRICVVGELRLRDRPRDFGVASRAILRFGKFLFMRIGVASRTSFVGDTEIVEFFFTRFAVQNPMTILTFFLAMFSVQCKQGLIVVETFLIEVEAARFAAAVLAVTVAAVLAEATVRASQFGLALSDDRVALETILSGRFRKQRMAIQAIAERITLGMCGGECARRNERRNFCTHRIQHRTTLFRFRVRRGRIGFAARNSGDENHAQHGPNSRLMLRHEDPFRNQDFAPTPHDGVQPSHAGQFRV